MSKVRVPDLIRKRQKNEKIVAITAYDATFSRLLDAAGVDILLVGDSLGTVIQGRETTLAVTLDEIIYHTSAVVRGAERALVVADLPFLSYQTSPAEAFRSAGRVLKETGASAVKLEGGEAMLETVSFLSERGVPVMAHLGLTPQSVHTMGGYKVQGREKQTAKRLKKDALALQKAGAFSLVLEGIPASLGAEITAALEIPTIGIGAGPECSGQILVLYDLLGLSDFGSASAPKFVKEFANLRELVSAAVRSYAEEVRLGIFPTSEQSYKGKEGLGEENS